MIITSQCVETRIILPRGASAAAAMMVDSDIFPTCPTGKLLSLDLRLGLIDKVGISVSEPLSLKVIIPVSMASAILSLIIAVYAIKSGYSCSNMRKDARSAAKSEIVIENAYETTGVQALTENSSVLYINKKSRTTPLTSKFAESTESSAVRQSMSKVGGGHSWQIFRALKCGNWV